MVAKMIPITTYTNDDVLPMFVVATLCGQSWMGMTHTPDLEIRTRKALEHAETCTRCADRWALLNAPNVILTNVPDS